jgi:hypothetical protein
MKRLVGIVAGTAIALLLLVPVVLAASPLPHTGRVLVSVGGDVTLPAGEHADVVVVTDGTATILGEANTVVVVNGTAIFSGARAEDVVAVRGDVRLGTGTVILNDVRTLDATVTRTGDAVVAGSVRDMSIDMVGIAAVIGPALFLLYLGFALATIVAGLGLAGLAARQVRAAETLISEEPGLTIVAGLAGLILPPLVAVIAIVTIVGTPLGLGILLGVWPLAAFLGYLVAGTWIGEWILRLTSPGTHRERPYLAAVVGLLVLEVVTVVPLIGALASFVGFGAVILLAWRTFRGDVGSRAPSVAPLATPAGA